MEALSQTRVVVGSVEAAEAVARLLGTLKEGVLHSVHG